MSNPVLKTTVGFTVRFELTENEAKALDAIAGYGHDEFLKVFEEKLGKHYIRPFKPDLIALFEKVKDLRPAISKIDEARKLLGLPSNHA